MARYWVLGLIIAIVVAMYLLRRSGKRSETVDLPLWEEKRPGRPDLEPEDGEVKDDTAPAVLSPRDWKPPKADSKGS